MKIELTDDAVRQLSEAPAVAAKKLLNALRVLAVVPQSGRRFPDESPFPGSFYKTVVIRPRRWSYRVIYEVVGDVLWVRFIFASSDTQAPPTEH